MAARWLEGVTMLCVRASTGESVCMCICVCRGLCEGTGACMHTFVFYVVCVCVRERERVSERGRFMWVTFPVWLGQNALMR